jgi:putative flippase GtrA
MTLGSRWIRFNAGGFYGFLLQLLLLTLLSRRLPLWSATAIAVEAAVLHNFVWHELFTWRERHVAEWESVFHRVMRFQIANGFVSLTGNVLITVFLRNRFHVPVIIANVTAIIACSIFNFVAGEWFVFRAKRRTYPEQGKMLFV